LGDLGNSKPAQRDAEPSTATNPVSVTSKPLYKPAPASIDHANSIATLESRLHAEFDLKLARLETCLERKIVDNDRGNVKVVVLEHKLKASEEANEEYKKQIVQLQKKIKDTELREEMGKLETME
jgi:CII-binding regulator of phage lambda lysogenization HflD